MITSVAIKNFKRFETVTVPLGETIVFAGPNNSGKTTAIQLCAAEITRLRKSSPDDNLFSAADLEKAKAILREFALPDVFVSPLTDTPFLMGTKVSDVVLEPFFKKFFTELHEYNTMPKSKFYRIAEVMESGEIHPEVWEKLDAIAEALELAEGKDLE